MPNCKYIKEQEIVSYNGGEDWQDVMPAQYRKGQLIEHGSEDCTDMDTIYRWRKLTGVYLCVDDVKYEKLILDESYDGGLSWYPAYPSQYTTGEEIGVDEDYCNDKFVGQYDLEITSSGGGGGHSCPLGTFWNGVRCVSRTGHGTPASGGGGHTALDPIKVVKCDGNPELTSADTKYYTSYPSNYKFSLFSAEIGKCVTSIVASAFTNSSALTYVSMADSVTSIGARAFYDCRSLSGMNTTIPGELNIPSGVTSIGNYAFYQCSGITSIICNSTTPPSLGGSNVFYGTNNCPIYVPCGSYGAYQESWSSVLDRLAPQGGEVCAPIKFRLYYNDTSVTYYCGNGTTITQANIDNTNINRGSISGISIGECVTAIGNRALSGCGFTSVTIPSGVTSIGDSAFTGCASLTNIIIPNTVTSLGENAFRSCTSLTSCTIGSGVTSINNNTFYGCRSLTSITIPNSVTSIGDNAFDSCSGLTSINIPDNVTRIGSEAFKWCKGLTTCTIGNGVTFIGGYAFMSCNNLTNVTIGTGITSIGGYAFDSCYGLDSITIYATTPPTLGNNAFLGVSNFTIYVPEESVNAYITASGWGGYWTKIKPIPKWSARYQDSHTESAACDSTSAITQNEISLTNLVSVQIGNCVETIGDNAFQYCSGLTSVVIPDSVTSIGGGAFYNCYNLTSIVIPDSVTSIGNGAFVYCTSLTSVSIGSGVTTIGYSAFQGCASLTSVTIYATTPPTLSNNALYYTNDCPIYVPSGSVNAYKSASGWSTYSSRIQAIT